MKKNLLLLLVPALLLVSCGKSEETNSSSDPSSQESGGGEIHTDPVVKIATIKLYGDDFKGVFPSSGVHFDTSANLTKLTDYINGQINQKGVLSALVPVNAHVGLYGQTTVFQFGGSSNFEGSLTWKSNATIKKVEATVENYNKFIEYTQVWSIDNASHFCIENDDHDLTYTTEGAPEEKTFGHDYDSNIKQFTISSYDGRVYVKELKITYTL